MSTLITLENFEEIYNKTYNNVLKYFIIKCYELDDVNELIQDTYVELYKVLKNKNHINVSADNAYVIGIAKNIVKRYYRNRYKEKSKLLYISKDIDNSAEIVISDVNLEADIINKENIDEIWSYLNNKDVIIAKIFYLYYSLGLKISEISKELKINESTIKNYIYRTLKELNKNFRKDYK